MNTLYLRVGGCGSFCVYVFDREEKGKCLDYEQDHVKRSTLHWRKFFQVDHLYDYSTTHQTKTSCMYYQDLRM